MGIVKCHVIRHHLVKAFKIDLFEDCIAQAALGYLKLAAPTISCFRLFGKLASQQAYFVVKCTTINPKSGTFDAPPETIHPGLFSMPSDIFKIGVPACRDYKPDFKEKT